MYFNVIKAKHIRDFKIDVFFEDESNGMVDLQKFIKEGTVMARLKDETLFKSFEIEYGTLVWKNEDLDIAPETLYEEATGKVISFEHGNRLVS